MTFFTELRKKIFFVWKHKRDPQISKTIFFFFFLLFRAAPAVYGGSQARSLIGAAAASLRQSHSNVGSQLHLRPTPQLTAIPDPSPTEQGQGSNPKPHGS